MLSTTFAVLRPTPGSDSSAAREDGHLAAEVLDQEARELDDVLGLVAVEADGADVGDEPLLAQRQHPFGRVGEGEEVARGLVDAGVGGLGRERDGHEEREGVEVLELALGMGVGGAEAAEDLDLLGVGELARHGGRYARAGRARQASWGLPAISGSRGGAATSSWEHPFAGGRAMEPPSYHYAVMRRAIDLIDAAEAPLSLEDLAGAMGMSPAHFQRVFSAWAGVSPKRYQQHLQLGQAKALLRDRQAVLEVAGAVGLSGPSRLHDLFLRWEAMTPGDYAKGGAGLVIRAGAFDTPFGPAVAMGTEVGLCGLGFAGEQGEAQVRADLAARWPRARSWRTPRRSGPGSRRPSAGAARRGST